MPIAAIILAAGTSTRLGHPKQLVTLDGETLLDRAVRTATAAGFSPVFVILPPARPDLAPSSPGPILIENPAAPEGMAASIRLGIHAARQTDAHGAVILACDQPAVTPAHLLALAADPSRVTASRYAGRNGVPAFFPRSTFPDLLTLTGDRGARDLLGPAHTVGLPEGDLDIDTPAELTRARVRFSAP